MKRQRKHGSGVLGKALSTLLGVALVGAYGVPAAAFAETASGAYAASGGGAASASADASANAVVPAGEEGQGQVDADSVWTVLSADGQEVGSYPNSGQAIEAVTSGGTVRLNADAETEQVSFRKSVVQPGDTYTVDLAGHAIATFGLTSNLSVTLKSSVTGGRVAATGTAKKNLSALTASTGTVRVEGIALSSTVTASLNAYAVSPTSTGSIVLSNCAVSIEVPSGTTVSKTGYTVAGIAVVAGTSVTVEGGSVTASVLDSSTVCGVRALSATKGGTLDVSNASLSASTVGSGAADAVASIGLATDSASLSLSACSLSSTGTQGYALKAYSGTVSLSGATTFSGATAEIIQKVAFSLGEGFSLESAAHVDMLATATEFENDVFATLAEGLDAAELAKLFAAGTTGPYVGKMAKASDDGKSLMWADARTVSFDLGYEGAPAVDDQKVADGTCASKPDDPTRAGFSFDGWYADGAEQAYEFSTPVTSNLTLTAKWTENPGEKAWKRLAGNTAIGTMKAIVNEGWGTSDWAIVATTGGYYDALSASGLAGLLDCPILMTASNKLSDATSTLIKSKGVKNVIVVGGTSAVSDAVKTQIEKLGVGVERVAGNTAIGTANAIYERGKKVEGGWGADAIVATAGGYQDALSIAPYAYAKKAPIFLARGSAKTPATLTDSTLAKVKAGGFARTIITGGTAAVASSVDAKVVNAKRLAGNTAYGTSKLIANFCISEGGMSAAHMGVATGKSYYDALAGAALCGKMNSVIVLADEGHLGNVTGVVKPHKDELRESCYIFGGTSAVSANVETTIKTNSK